MADTHLLGPRRGHWFDKIRRESQMHRAFQAIMTLHKPEAVFFLGNFYLFKDLDLLNLAELQNR